MKSLPKFLLWLAGVTVFLVLTAHVTLRYSLNTPKFKAAATRYMERTTGRTAEYDRIDYTLFPFSLVVRDVSVKERDGTQDFASMREFAVLVDWRTKEITSLKLAEPTIRIVQYADGRFNFSDLLPTPPPAPPVALPPDPSAPRPVEAPEPKPAPVPAAPTEPPLSIRLVAIEQARFEFVTVRADGQKDTFALTDLDFTLRDYAPGLPVHIEGKTTLGKTSSLDFQLSGPPLADHAGNLGAWPIDLNARLDIGDVADLRVFLPDDTLPFQRLQATLETSGTLADRLQIVLRLQTPEATERHPLVLQTVLRSEFSLPGPVVSHLVSGTPLPEEWRVDFPPCDPPPGTMALTEDPATALALRHLQARLDLTFPNIAYGAHVLTDGSATLQMHNGILSIPAFSCTAYGGALQARGEIDLLACPLSYAFESITANHLAIEEALVASDVSTVGELSGRLHLDASLAGQAVGEPALRSLSADAALRIDDLQTVGDSGSLMDQVWLQLDNVILLRLAPRLRTKVDEARQSSGTVTTSRYEEATATLALRDGTATLSDARLALPGYRFALAGTILPFDDRMDLTARLIASPEETRRLTDGKDRSAYLPYEDGGLMIPLTLRGPLRKPVVLPDLDHLLKNALSGGALPAEIAPHLERLSESDQQRLQEGLEEGIQILRGLGRRSR